MSLSGSALLTGLCTFMGDLWASATTSAGSTTTLIDTALRTFGSDDALNGWYIRITSGTYTLSVVRITTYEQATGTVTFVPALGGSVASGVSYQLHRYDPRGKFTALDEARLRGFPEIAQIVYDESITGDGETRDFDIPSTIRSGPAFAREEEPLGTGYQWNFLGSPLLDNTSVWTGSSATLSTVAQDPSDPLVPKYDPSCMKVVVAASTAATVTQVVADMENGITAAKAAGRRMTFALWFYCTVANKVRLQLLTDAGTLASGAYHGGAGWQLLTVTGTVAGNNATTLSVRIDITSTSSAMTGYMNRGWFYYGTAMQVNNRYGSAKVQTIRRDDTTQRVYLPFTPLRGRQVQLVGRAPLSALGTTASSQITNTMEIDEPSAQLLYAIASQIIFEREGITAESAGEVAPRIQAVIARKREYAPKFPFALPQTPAIKGPWVK